MNQPTPEEFIHCRSKELNDVVQTADGRLFRVENNRLINGLKTAVRVLASIAISIITISYTLHDAFWAQLNIDMNLAIAFLAWLATRLLYYRARFVELEPGGDEVEAASEGGFSKPTNRFVFIAMGIFLLALFLHSFTFTYLRSVIYNEARIESVRIYDDDPGMVFNTDNISLSDAQTVYLPSNHPNGYLGIDVTTVCTPSLAVLSIDGQPFTGINYRRLLPNWFWASDYFRQECWFNPQYANIRDVSTLTLTCGSLHREWTVRYQP
jgi:hypothetical protein